MSINYIIMYQDHVWTTHCIDLYFETIYYIHLIMLQTKRNFAQARKGTLE
jgi:hypothetical protein